MKQVSVLFIEDDRAGREMGAFNLKKAGYDVEVAATGEEGLAKFDSARHRVVITDVKMPGISGMEVLKQIRDKAPNVPVLVITAYADVNRAVEAMKLGAFDFIGKPFNRDHLLLTVQKAVERQTLHAEVRHLRIKASGIERPIVHASDAVDRVIEIADRVADSEATVLITGESGTGKELIARRIHVSSKRAEGPFVALNAAAMPKDLIEAELFGYEKGAFTGADHARIGRFRHAEGGTLFLDEIGELPLPLQGKLLRVLQEKCIEPLGMNASLPVNARIVAATNRDMQAAVADGDFREDLFYRLNVVEIQIPPLRDRPDDILPLAHHFILKLTGTVAPEIPREIREKLLAHTWPGNVRELENTCHRLVLLSKDGQLAVTDLPPRFQTESGARAAEEGPHGWPALPPDGVSLFDLERQVIERVLTLKEGNVSQAALFLKVPRHVLSYRMEKYGISKKSGGRDRG